MAAELVADCPRCRAKMITFDLTQDHFIGESLKRNKYEAFCVCRHCNRATIFTLTEKKYIDHTRLVEQGLSTANEAVNCYVDVTGFVSLKDHATIEPPEHTPVEIAAAFTEGVMCHAIGCHNAAATMFRLCVDIATRQMLPDTEEQGLNAKVRRNLGLRLPWLFETNRLPAALCELSACIKEDGNDGAHEGTLSKEDADDLLDFTIALLERIYTEPERLRQANERRVARRNPQ